MLISICQDIFSNSSNDSYLDNLLTFFRLGKHQLILNNPDDFLSFENSTWKKQIKGDDLKLITRGLKHPQKYKREIIISENEFSLEEAFLYLDQPLVVLVENKEYEPPFFNAIINKFDDYEIEDAHKNKWWKYEMFAGSSVEQVINGELENEFNNTCFKKEKFKYLRYFVIMDSDKTHINMINNTLDYKIEFLKSVKVDYHVLHKREKENYLPGSKLNSKNIEYFNCFLRVFKDNGKRQRDFFDIEKGFNKKNKSDGNWKNNRKEEADFFEINDIGDKDWEILKKGVLDRDNFKSTFSKDFNSVEKSEFLQVIKYQPLIKSEIDGEERNEYEHIVNEIKRLL
ncbi:hypothetical protein [Flavobacterium sp.]|uniref:hypothetical protein n=1 Tax=Flavobacterium sp. TaxID=239 RepID=UPI00286EA4C3|nr:hypothetical protein [Flavobacterium sp.]